jgi:putative transposase
MRTGRNWRDLPEEFGAWKTVYSRYRRWCNEGLWHQIRSVLQDADP